MSDVTHKTNKIYAREGTKRLSITLSHSAATRLLPRGSPAKAGKQVVSEALTTTYEPDLRR